MSFHIGKLTLLWKTNQLSNKKCAGETKQIVNKYGQELTKKKLID